MTFTYVMSAIIATGLGFTAWFFRKGGIYNPSEPLPEGPELPQDENSPEIQPILPTPSPEPYTPHVESDGMLATFCGAIRDFEGKPGDANYRNNNPGNCRFSRMGYLPKYGNVRRSPSGFAIFPTYELGWEYLLAMVLNQAKAHPKWTIYDFFYNYAPKSDGNNPMHYAEVVAERCGVIPKSTLGTIFHIVI